MRPRSPHLLALITVPLSVRVSAGAGRSSAVRMAFTPGIASAALASMLPHARMRHGAQQQLAEEHAVGAKVFRIFRLAGYFGIEVGRRIVLADQLVAGAVLALGRLRSPLTLSVISMVRPPAYSRRRASARSESCRSPGSGRGCPKRRAPVPARVGFGLVFRYPTAP